MKWTIVDLSLGLSTLKYPSSKGSLCVNLEKHGGGMGENAQEKNSINKFMGTCTLTKK